MQTHRADLDSRSRMMVRFRSLPMVIACALGLLPAAAAHAQWRTYQKSNEPRLTKQDLDARNAATKELLDRPQLGDGAFEVWSSPASGVNGTIIAGKAATRHGLACRELTYFTNVPGPGPRPTSRMEIGWCKTDAGWKMG